MSNTYKSHNIELRTCGDCGALPGYAHDNNCDVARCPLCGEQRLQCYIHKRSKIPSIWTGIYPGEVECIEYGLWSKFVYIDNGKPVDYMKEPAQQRKAYWVVKTTAEDQDGTLDLNTLMLWSKTGKLAWSRKLQRWVKPDYTGTK